ncbi:flagellar basal body protein FliL [Paenibacillus swuensis]|uniref:Flagellar protein FliL n=1 Tax=Paenibacillus swuensis TaxID=1178515 RepID=A0A172TKQ0_9BACL|nr:flagellar basal body-associated FliL family protein [Paenibacillus swuensis]ANE47546.1 flagellar basal body protein FliL [Paenibacillus swuensis]
MFKRMMPWLAMVLVIITLIMVAAFALWNYMSKSTESDNPNQQAKDSVSAVQAKKLSAEEILEVSSVLDNITTNLADKDYVVKMSFAFQLDHKKTKEEFDQIANLKIKPIIVRTLADMTPDQVTGGKGFDVLSAKLLNLINTTLPEGKLIQVEITDFVITPLN